MNEAAVKNLKQLKGVGEISARRLVEAGLDDFAKVAAAGVEGLGAIRGMNPRSIPGILQQAGELTGPPDSGCRAKGADKAARLARVRELIQQLQLEVSGLVAPERAEDQSARGRKSEALFKEAAKLGKLLGKLEAALPARLKRTGKALTKADRKVAELAGRGPKKAASGLKKARKTLKKALT